MGTKPSGSSASAQLSDDGHSVYVRVAVSAATTVNLRLHGDPVSGHVKQTTISAANLEDANSPRDPTFVSPVSSTAIFQEDGSIALPANSFSVLEVPFSAHGGDIVV